MKKNTAQNAASFSPCSTGNVKSACLGRSLKNTKISQLKKRCTLAVGRLLASVDRELKTLVKVSFFQEVGATLVIACVSLLCCWATLVTFAEHGFN